jgi:sec-independent protein translocase protein TatA
MPSGPEWIIVLVIVLLVFGGSQLPKLAKNLGKAQKEFKEGLADGQKEEQKDGSGSSSSTS